MKKTPEILCIIPARGGSKGVPRKNIREVGGKPLIYWAIKAATDSGVVTRLVVSTDDDDIASVAEQYGAEVVMRPAELASDTATTESAMIHVIETLEQNGYTPDYVSLIQCTSPFLDGEVVRAVSLKLIESNGALDSCATFYKPHYAFRWKQTEEGHFVSEYPVVNRPRRQDLALEYPYCGAGAFYIVGAELFKKTQNRYGGNDARIGGVEISEADALQIDSEYDLWIADQRMTAKLRNTNYTKT